MKQIEKRELELLAKICNQSGVPLKLANALLKSAKKFSYENVTSGTRIKEYDELITFHTKNNE